MFPKIVPVLQGLFYSPYHPVYLLRTNDDNHGFFFFVFCFGLFPPLKTPKGSTIVLVTVMSPSARTDNNM